MLKYRLDLLLAIALVVVSHAADAIDIDTQGGPLKYEEQFKRAGRILAEAIREQRFEHLRQIQGSSGYLL